MPTVAEPTQRQPRVAAILRINMSGSLGARESEADRYAAALELASFADRSGFAVVNVEEHHDSQIGWLPSPLIMAGLIVPHTERLTVRACALLVTLYDPIRLAEDIAILDIASRGRFVFVMGQGYRPSEYHALDREWAGRGAASEHVIETLLEAWRGPFTYRGRRIHVSPRPFTQPHPPFFYGGMSATAVRRAARFGLPWFPPQPMPELEALYIAECDRLGTRAHVERHDDMSLLYIAEDPDRAWAEIGPWLLREAEEYALWARGGVERRYEAQVTTVDELRRQRVYEILTPDECLERARACPGIWKPILHPLAGGIPIAQAEACMQLFAERVLARL
jgi:alkanesulfonate monooxygenase SsuD/methylene tetrahydromethanopterin reductase-like flavin-dependent oxidoreductase (luciferase family)